MRILTTLTLITGWTILTLNPTTTTHAQTNQQQQQQQPLPAKPPPGLHPVKPEGIRDPQAERILKKMSDRFSKLRSYQVTFELKMDIPDTDQDEIRQGKLIVQGKRFRFEMDGILVVCDGQTKWQYLRETNEVQISDYLPEEQVFEPKDIFALHHQDFYYMLQGEKTVRGQPVYVIELTPVNRQESYFKIRMYVHKKRLIPIYVVIFEKSGTRYYLTVNSFIDNVPIPDVLFTFHPEAYPGITIVDLRE